MVEAIKGVIDYLFTQTSITEEAYAFVRSDNVQSGRVLEKAGFSLHKTNERQELLKGQKVTLNFWIITKAAWKNL